jgi:hypothetical protein
MQFGALVGSGKCKWNDGRLISEEAANGRKDDDPTGMWLADDGVARDYAEQLISEIKEGERHDPSLTMVVERAGTVLFTLQG